MRPRIVPDVVPRGAVASVAPGASVRAAARLMAGHRVAALLVVEGEAVAGIVTEHDVTARLVAAGLDPDATPVSAIMSPNPHTLAPDDSVGEALELMRRRDIRHLPVVEGGRPVAMVSVRDLYAAVQVQMEADILHRDAWILGLSDAWGDGL